MQSSHNVYKLADIFLVARVQIEIYAGKEMWFSDVQKSASSIPKWMVGRIRVLSSDPTYLMSRQNPIKSTEAHIYVWVRGSRELFLSQMDNYDEKINIM